MNLQNAKKWLKETSETGRLTHLDELFNLYISNQNNKKVVDDSIKDWDLDAKAYLWELIKMEENKTKRFNIEIEDEE
jgi:hypothetical protein